MWNVLDTAYSVAGVLVALVVGAVYGPEWTIFTGGLLLVAYLAGRTSSRHR